MANDGGADGDKERASLLLVLPLLVPLPVLLVPLPLLVLLVPLVVEFVLVESFPGLTTELFVQLPENTPSGTSSLRQVRIGSNTSWIIGFISKGAEGLSCSSAPFEKGQGLQFFF